MPIDPSIPLASRPAAFNNPFEVLAQMQQVKAQQQVINSNKALEKGRLQDIEKQQREEEAQRRFYGILSTTKTPDEAEARIQAEAPEMLGPFRENRLKLDKLSGEIRNDQLQAKKLEADRKVKEQEYLAPLLQMVEKSGYDPKVFDFALTLASSQFEGLPVDQLRSMATDPQRIKQLVDGFKTPQQQNADTTAATAAAQLPGIQADTQAKQAVASKMSPEGLTPDQQRQGAQSAATLAQQKAMQTLTQSETARHNRQMEARAAAGSQEPLIAIMGPDGKPVLTRRSQAEGKTPATTREQGRQVTLTGAERIAELDTSINDLDTLAKDIGTTGAGSKIGAMLPNVVSEYTGVGTESKQRQATIDRVKQVIGKALEGGVLRKEDEEKYKLILPTIGDPPDVAKTKLDGLRKALVQRRQTTLDALKDANYDVTNFEKRTPPAAPKPTAADLIKKYGG